MPLGMKIPGGVFFDAEYKDGFACRQNATDSCGSSMCIW